MYCLLSRTCSGGKHEKRQDCLMREGISKPKMQGVISVGKAEAPSYGIEDQFSKSKYLNTNIAGKHCVCYFPVFIYLVYYPIYFLTHLPQSVLQAWWKRNKPGSTLRVNVLITIPQPIPTSVLNGRQEWFLVRSISECARIFICGTKYRASVCVAKYLYLFSCVCVILM